MILRGTNVNPSMLQSPLDVAKKVDEQMLLHRGQVEKQYATYRKYLETEQGRITSELVDPMIAKCDYTLSKTSVELGLTIEQAREYHDTIRGVKSVWVLLKTEPNRLKKELEELNKLCGDEGKKSGWGKPPKSSEKDLAVSATSPLS